MRQRTLIISIPISLLLLLFCATVALGNSPPPEPPSPPAPVITVAQDEVVTPVAVSVTPAAICKGKPSDAHQPVVGRWWTPDYMHHRYLVIEFWTNEPGRNQKIRAVYIPKSADIELRGGGRSYSWACGSGKKSKAAAIAAFNRNSNSKTTITWLKDQGLARNRH